MKCSDCGQVIKPVVAVDIDGTIADYHLHFLQFARNYLLREIPRDVPVYDGEGTFRDWFCWTFKVDVRTWHDIKLAYRQGGMKRNQPVLPGGDTFVNDLRRLGIEVWLTTTRPYLRLDNIDPDTRFWLNAHGIKFDGLLFDEDKYSVLFHRLHRDRVIAIVDDLEEQYDAAANIFGENIPILRSQYFNRAIRRPNMGDSLSRILTIIQGRLHEWHREH